MHQALEVVHSTKGVQLAMWVLVKIMSLTFGNILPQYLHILVTIRARLFMPKASGVHEFVHYDSFLITSGTNR